MPPNPPNIVLILTDQQRGDCLGLAGHPVVQTPYLDALGAEGAWFRRAYSACPVCIPARRTIMTGRPAASHGVLNNAHTELSGPFLAEELARAGYQTHLSGKLHLWPLRKRYGFQSTDWADAAFWKGEPNDVYRFPNDYHRFLMREGLRPEAGSEHGCNPNGWVSRPWHLPERFHFTNWCVTSALDFLERRDPTVPFFLNVSFLAPHQPCTPPEVYYNRYLAMDLPEPRVADWARLWEEPPRGLPVASWRTALSPALMRQFRAAYYGSINHIDDQIGRLLEHLPKETVILFASDHGEMLGDQQWIRKRSPYEPSSHVPFLISSPKSPLVGKGLVIDELVELMDVMPTLLDLAGAPIPAAVEGKSVLPLLRGESAPWREFLHGECSCLPGAGGGMQFLTDGRWKYVWFPGTGLEQYFDLETDPHELADLANDPACGPAIAAWRERLVAKLNGRPEGFVEAGKLVCLGGETPAVLPGFGNAG